MFAQIKFDSPVVISRIQISDAAPTGPGTSARQPPPMLRIYARDNYALSASRFATLCPNTITCPASGQLVEVKAEVSTTCCLSIDLTCMPVMHGQSRLTSQTLA